MKGYQLEFFTQQDHFHGGKPVSDWLIDMARSHGIRGASVFKGATGFGPERRFPEAQMFDLIDHPMQVLMIVSEEECERLFALLMKEKIDLFYVKLPVEYGKVGT